MISFKNIHCLGCNDSNCTGLSITQKRPKKKKTEEQFAMPMPVYYTDGGTKNNGKYGFQESVICVADNEGKSICLEEIGDKTNNEAELMAIIACLERTGDEFIHIYSDSTLAIGLATGRWKTKKPHLQVLADKIKKLKKFSIEWVSRQDNKAGWIIESIYNL